MFKVTRQGAKSAIVDCPVCKQAQRAQPHLATINRHAQGVNTRQIATHANSHRSSLSAAAGVRIYDISLGHLPPPAPLGLTLTPNFP